MATDVSIGGMTLRWMCVALFLGAGSVFWTGCSEAASEPAGVLSDSDGSGDIGASPDAPGGNTPSPDAGPAHPVSGPRAYLLSDPAEVGQGDMAAARIGDIVLQNDLIRLVIRNGGSALILAGIGDGTLVDAGSAASDRLQEALPLVGFSSLGAGVATITANGTDGVAEVSITAPAATPPLLAEYIPGVGVVGGMTHRYRLEAGQRSVELTTTFDGAGEQLMGDILFLGGELDAVVNETEGWLASEGPEISYGLVAAEPVAVADFGGITMVLGPTVTAPVSWTRWLVIGDGSMSSVVDEMLERRMSPSGAVSGRVTPAGASVVAYAADDSVTSRFRPNAAGDFGGRLPVGLYTLVAEGPGQDPGAPIEVDVTDGASLADINVSGSEAAALRITLDMPMRITLVPEGGGRVVHPLAPGTHDVPAPPGSYTVYATRGFEWEADSVDVVLSPGDTLDWTPSLERVVDTTGWIAADFHLHSEWSADSNVPLGLRVLSCAAEGIEYAVATDHDVVTDYTPSIPEAVGPFIRVGIGVEVSTRAHGHLNLWPVPLDANAPGRGAPLWHGLKFDPLMELLNPEAGGRVLQVNHGRSGNGFDTFDALDLQTGMLDDAGLERLRFNAVEVINGGLGDFDALVADWMGLVTLGKAIAATGVSDSHAVNSYCGHGRTMVRVADTDLAGMDVTTIDAAVLAMQTSATTGPFVTLETSGSGVVHLRVQAPSFVPVDQVEIFVDGVADLVVEIPPGEAVVRIDEDLTLLNQAGSWVVAVARTQAAPTSPMLKEAVRALSAPLFMGR